MADRRPVKCLVVDDDSDGADVMGEFLEALGAEVRVVYGGQHAIDVAPYFQPRMVVLDLNMPAMDGFETCRRLRQQPWSHDAVIVAYTGLPVAKANLIAAGFDHFVAKGDSPEAFATLLDGVAL